MTGGRLRWLDELPLGLVVLAALLLGLAPFQPEPHVWEKLKLLMDGALIRPLDILDLLLHGSPFLILVLKLLRMRQLSRH
mgnify:CR=1 FL=1